MIFVGQSRMVNRLESDHTPPSQCLEGRPSSPALGVPVVAGRLLFRSAAMTNSDAPARFWPVFRLPAGRHEYPAQGLEGRGPPGPEDDSDDDPDAEPAERGEMQQVR